MSAWAALLRLPNLLTVPGDVFAGAALSLLGLFAAGTAPDFSAFALPVVLCAVSSLCMYSAGVALNDFADRDIDAAERPLRPLPSGAIPPRAAFMAGVALLAGALAASRGVASSACAGAGVPIREFVFLRFFTLPAEAPLAVAGVLAAVVALYDFPPFRRRMPHAALAVIALCRGLNVLLGAAAVEPFARAAGVPPHVWARFPLAGAAAMALYTAAFSAVARRETDSPPPRLFYAPAAALVLGLVPVLLLCAASIPEGTSCVLGAPRTSFALPAFAGAIAILHCLVLARFFASRVPAPFVVGRFIGNIARVQAALVLCAWPCGAALVCGAVLFFVPAAFNALAAKLPPS